MHPFQRILTGLLLILIDIHLGSIEVLPDFAGYLLILYGLKGLEDHLAGIKSARLLALMLTMAALPQMFLGQAAGNPGSWQLYGDPVMVYHQALGLLKVILSYYLFRMLLDWAGKKGFEELMKRTNKVFIIYITGHLIYYTFLPFTMNMNDQVVYPLYFLALAFVLIMETTLLVLFRTYHHERYKITIE